MIVYRLITGLVLKKVCAKTGLMYIPSQSTVMQGVCPALLGALDETEGIVPKALAHGPEIGIDRSMQCIPSQSTVLEHSHPAATGGLDENEGL